MKIIAHRGNLNGPCVEENTPLQIQMCLDLGYDVEIDLWYNGKKYLLGHDAPTVEIPIHFLRRFRDQLWIHCKNDLCLFQLAKENEFHYFWHERDQYTLTSQHIIWSYPESYCEENCVVLLPERTVFLSEFPQLLTKYKDCYGICTDYPELLKTKL